MSRLSRGHRAGGEEGAVALIVALMGTVLLVAAALVVDIAQARLDRQASKSAADASVMAGVQYLDGGTSDPFPLRGVCGALSFLRSNEPVLAALPTGICGGAWQNDPTVCDPLNPAASVKEYTGSVTSGGVVYSVRVKSPYQLSDGGFPEESYATSTADGSALNGCDQLAVIITKERDPTFGRVVSDDPLTTTIRSVGRVIVDPGENAPALLLLERTKCNVLSVGSAGAPSSIKVYGNADVPGTIHADTAASDTAVCADQNDKRVFQGNQANGIVAYGSTDGDSGLITSYAGTRGVPATTISDGIANVYGTTAVNETDTAGTATGPLGRGQIGRGPVDQRYRLGVRDANSQASTVWAMTPGALPTGWTQVGCSPTAAQLDALDPSSMLYIHCTHKPGINLGTPSAPVTIKAGTIVFNGFVKSGNVRMPNATRVYVSNRNNSGGLNNAAAVSLTNNDGFCIGDATCDPAAPTTGACPTTATSVVRKLFVLHGALQSTGTSLLRMCNTTAYMLGGQTDGCVPSANGALPSDTPCTGNAGTGQVDIKGSVNWTAPNAYAGAIPDAQQSAAWQAGEDLAMWAESAATSSDKFVLGGGGTLAVAGVFFTPNAMPFQLNGGANQDLTNAQFVTRAFTLGGRSNLRMRVDPNNAVRIPDLEHFLVR